ncbi:hypothetical protein KCV87_31070 [Actinosynnema pretiosum subsp. pretiosum]|uniref:Uncharacterized protein n=1 Tax=Actinosynnema pretiosum subsp. pretiosum TaxID=103721 RepID=A0AA45L6J6_9PSEU|nr:hypothetical protein KCV87_31070 [Actinosynnema pretiosum subsp. pretiosum]
MNLTRLIQQETTDIHISKFQQMKELTFPCLANFFPQGDMPVARSHPEVRIKIAPFRMSWLTFWLVENPVECGRAVDRR